MNTQSTESLPQDVKEYVLDQLKAYDSITVVYENGHYTYGVCIKSVYAPDHKVIGTFYAKDIYNETEQIENYINTFANYPIKYKGKRNYQMLKDMQESGYKKMGKLNAEGSFELI